MAQFRCSLLRDDDEPGAKEVEVGATVTFCLAVRPGLAERGSDSVDIGTEASGEGRQRAGFVRISEHSVSGSGDIRSAIPTPPVTGRVAAELGFVVSATGSCVNL